MCVCVFVPRMTRMKSQVGVVERRRNKESLGVSVMMMRTEEELGHKQLKEEECKKIGKDKTCDSHKDACCR
jgi:hypothetical protein